MADYSKQTVAQLRQVLKERGIPSTGLTRKQQIIDKLQEHDAVAASPPAEDASPETEPVAESEAAPEAALEDQDATPVADGANAEAVPEDQNQQDDATESKPEEEAIIEKVSGEAMPESAPEPALPHHETIQPTEEMPIADAIAGRDFQDATAQAEVVQLPEDDPAQRPTTAATSVSQTPIPSHERPSPTPAAEPPFATADSSRLGSPELKEDKRKRKRRSVTPPVDPGDAAKKRLKQDEDNGPIVHLKEDIDAEQQKTKDVVMEEADVPVDAAPAETVLPAKTSDDVADITGSQAAEELKDSEGAHREYPSVGERGQQVLEEKEEQRTRGKSPEGDKDAESARRPSTSHKPQKEGRYKSLLGDASSAHVGTGTTEPANPSEDDDRPISPALHPATGGLYIRDFMRPLQPLALKNHLIALASPPSTSTPDPNVLELFHLDPIRTHVLALFNSVSAAARVRNSLHGSVWPVERTRKALWADFIPEEKVSEWIEHEEKDAGGRMGKRWEVVYESDEGGDTGVRAELREAGASGSRPSARTTASASSPTGTAPAAPARKPPTGPAAEKSFLALDKLFRSTTAKPKLYFLPVEKEVAEKRLDELDRCTGRDWKPSDVGGGTERRYTFEDGSVLVDAGPDAETYDGVRGRGRVQYRGAYGQGGGGGGPGGRFRDRGWGVQPGLGGPPGDARWRR